MDPRWARNFLYDMGCVLAFVVIGRRSHDEGNAARETIAVALPFILGLSAGYGASWSRRSQAATIRFGIVVWAATLVVGVTLRRVAFDRGIAFTFVIVASLFLGLTLVGRRLVVRERPRRRRAASVSSR